MNKQNLKLIYLLAVLFVLLLLCHLFLFPALKNESLPPVTGESLKESLKSRSAGGYKEVQAVRKAEAEAGTLPGGIPRLFCSILKVGKADAIIIECGSETMIIDTGEDEDGEEIVGFLENTGREKVDTLIITHFDKDHVGGADTLIENVPVEEVILPAYESDSEQYLEFVDAMETAGIRPLRLTEDYNTQLSGSEVTVQPPSSYEIPEDKTEYDNNFSLITTINHGSQVLVFAGDAQKHRVREYLESGSAGKSGFLKVPHHGRYEKALPDLFAALSPEYAAICDSNKNPADEETLEALEDAGISVFETKNGDITLISDGTTLKMYQD